MKAKAILISLLLIASVSIVFAQKEWSNWYLDRSSMMTFRNGNAQLLTNYINPVPPNSDFYHYYNRGAGGISYSDPITGTMKFIISNMLGFNSTFHGFPNPSNTYMRACPSDYAYHIVPFQSDTNKFYVIQFQDCITDLMAQQEPGGLPPRCQNAFGLGYSIVDMRLDSGRGNFSLQNQFITSPLTAQMTTVHHANHHDVWVIVHPYSSSIYQAYLVTDAGIQPPVQSSIGPYIGGNWRNVMGELTASHDGKTLAGASGIDVLSLTLGVQLFDFNDTTGVLSNYRTLPYYDYARKLQFSPDNSKLYTLGYNAIYQYDMNSSNIGSTITKVVDHGNEGLLYDMQVGLDGKIYVTKSITVINNVYIENIGAIQCPNLPQYACNFNPAVFNNNPVAFQDLINDFINQPAASPPPKFSLGNDTAMCFGSITLSAPVGWQSYKWNTGDTTRQLNVTRAGTYYVLAGSTAFSCPSAYGYIKITDRAIKLNLGPDTTLCPQGSYLVHVPNNYNNILWLNGSTTRDSIIRTNSTTIIISATDQNGCLTRDTISVYFKNYPRANFGPDTTLCTNQTLLLHLLPAPDPFNAPPVYLWQNNSIKDTFRVTQPGIYWGQAIYQGCTARDTINVSYVTAYNVNLGPDTTLCQGDSLILQPNVSNASYLWSTGQTTSSIVVRTTGSYWVRVNNGSCSVLDTINVTFQSKPNVFLGNDTSLCNLQKITLHAFNANATYLWQDNSTKDSLVVSQPGSYWVHVSKNGCSASDTIVISYKPLPALNLGNDTGICANQSLLLNAFNSSISSYMWQNGSALSTFNVNQAGLYYVTATGFNGCINKDSIVITTHPLPVFSLGNDTIICVSAQLQLSVNLTNAGYMWNTGNISNTQQVTLPGIYWLDVTQNGCVKRDSIFIQNKPMPVVNLGNDTTLCEGSSKSLDATNSGAIYQWQNNSSGPVQLVRSPGTYSVKVNLDGCIKSDTIIISYLNKPIFVLGNDTSLCAGQKLTLKPVLTNVSYLWQDGSSLPFYNIDAPGLYKLTATNTCGSASHQILITRGLCQLLMPNAFSPNRDGQNDLFRVKYPGFIKTFGMHIYNRFGQEIFYTQNPNMGWDGTYQGIDQPVGIYVWQITLTTFNGDQQSKKGTVMLLR